MRPEPGYTLAEVAVCVGILSILTLVVMVGVFHYRLRNEAAECRGNIQLLYHAVSEYALDYQLPHGATVTLAQLQTRYLPANHRIVCPATTGLTYGSHFIVGAVPRCPAGIATHRWSPSELPGL